MSCMAARKGAPRGTRQQGGGPRAADDDRRSLYTGTRLTREEHSKAHRAAAALGVSLSGYLAELVRRDQVDDTGRPVWAYPAETPNMLPGLLDPSAA
jgi:hypothetical protein